MLFEKFSDAEILVIRVCIYNIKENLSFKSDEFDIKLSKIHLDSNYLISG
jgi:hypothetical protein